MKGIRRIIAIFICAAILMSSTGSFTFASEESNNITLSSEVSGEEVIRYAEQFLGKRYVWGGNGPDSFDCTGLVKYVYNHFGINVPRVTKDWQNLYSQYGIKITNMSDLQLGDVLLFGNSASSIGHAGLYYGSNKVLHALNSHTGVVINAIGDVHPNYQYAIRVNGVGVSKPQPPAHTHSWQTGYESAHPHRQYRQCSCGASEYTGGTQLVSSCSSCHPIGNVSFTRSFSRTGRSAEFYRNNVSNADSYTLTLYRNGGYYNSYTMYSRTQNVSNLPSGTYTATLTARNNSTGQERNASCGSFTIVDTYTVSYNANGGSNAPSQQTKIKDEDLTITSSIPKKTGHIFKGWASSKNATEVQYQAGGVYTKNTPITLYAVWEPETYTINFDTNGGNGEIESTTITYGNSMKMPNGVIKEGFYLRGWSRTKNSSTADYRLGLDYALTENMTLYAVWGVSTWGGTVAQNFAGGDGTKDNPYQISNAAELAHAADKINTQSSSPEYEYYILTDNIDLGYEEWVPIGLHDNDNQYFYGSFDGNGYTVSNMSISKSSEGYIGLFGYTKNSEIKGLTVAGDITGVTSSNTLYIGAVTGYCTDTVISDCNGAYVNISNMKSTSSGYSYIGCIAGKAENGSITKCGTEECYINLSAGNFKTGMIAGESSSDITDCSVKSTEELIGTSSSAGMLTIGGLCGELSKKAEKCTVEAGFLSNTIQSSKDVRVGGLVGDLSGSAELCTVKFNYDSQKSIDGAMYPSSIYAVSTSDGNIGGIAGVAENSAKVKDCKYDGKSVAAVSTGNSYTGGLIGKAYAKRTPTISVSGGQTLNRSSLPTRSGYTAEWYTNSALTEKYDFSEPVTSDMTLYAKWVEGGNDIEIWDGTSSEPAYNSETKTYTITNGKELAWVSDVTHNVIKSGTNFPDSTSFNGYTIELANDIYLNDISDVDNWATNPPANKWNPIGDFYGIFDGKNYTINGLYYSGTDKYVGLFGYVNGDIKNITVDNGYINSNITSSNTAYISNIAAYVYRGEINNCTGKLKIKKGSRGVTGGIVGEAWSSVKIIHCCNMSDIDSPGTQYVAGIVGHIIGGEITNCINTGNINAYDGSITGTYVGGIVGCSSNPTKIENCINKGSIYGYSYIGGISGSMGSGTISNCYNIGGIYGGNGGSYTGGIIGKASDLTIQKSYNNGTISGNGDVGGICGSISGGNVSTCYSGYGSITAKTRSGGLFGSMGGNLDNSLYVNNCYTDKSPYYGSQYDGCIISSTSYKSSSSMKTLSNLSGFSTSDWGTNSNYNDGYPYLKSLEETYKNYKISVVEDVDDSAAVRRSFANIDGILYSGASKDAYTGGIMGFGSGSSDSNMSSADSLLTVADRISSTSSGSSYNAVSGDIIGKNANSLFGFDNIHSYSNIDLSAINTAKASNASTNPTAEKRPLTQIQRVSFLKNVFGPNTYQSLDYLKEHPDAVWVVRDGELPELYYNILNDVTLSKVENGTISVDKTQAVDGEIVTVTAVPADNYQLNTIYVNGSEIVGNTFEISGDSDVFATFSEKKPEYSVKVSASDNASASLINVDAAAGISLLSVSDNISVMDGDEVLVNTQAEQDYTVDSVRVNGEELASDSFIVTADSVVTMDVTSLSTEVKAVTNEAANIGNYFATLSGSVEDSENVSRYIRYWVADTPDEIYTTEVQGGGGDYEIEVTNLLPETEYQYQMTETGEIKSFVTDGYYYAEQGDDPNIPPEDNPDDPTFEPIEIVFEISNAEISEGKVTADIVNISENEQSGLVIFAAYNENDALVSAQSKNADNIAAETALPVEFDIPETAQQYKLLVWNSYKGIGPLAECVEVR